MNKIIIGVIRAYRAFGFGPSVCRFIPSCSRYCEEALVSHGTIKGSWLCINRILKCNPLITKELTYDPVE